MMTEPRLQSALLAAVRAFSRPADRRSRSEAVVRIAVERRGDAQLRHGRRRPGRRIGGRRVRVVGRGNLHHDLGDVEDELERQRLLRGQLDDVPAGAVRVAGEALNVRVHVRRLAGQRQRRRPLVVAGRRVFAPVGVRTAEATAADVDAQVVHDRLADVVDHEGGRTRRVVARDDRVALSGAQRDVVGRTATGRESRCGRDEGDECADDGAHVKPVPQLELLVCGGVKCAPGKVKSTSQDSIILP